MQSAAYGRRYNQRMNDAAAPNRGGRGSDLLLQHCTALTDPVARPPAYRRLEQLVGCELARMLVAALAGQGHGRLAA
jgi:hypothetical protein